jgi:L-asparaginase
MKRILLIHTGGTFGMIPIEPSRTLAPGDVRDQISRYLPDVHSIARVDFEVAFNIDSANIQISHWQILARLIRDKYEEYDGFVIIHGTDAMVYTASALSFMLRGLSKPVIMTGSQRPLSNIRSDARSNLINSLELATYKIPEVAIFFGTNLYRGNRTVKISSTRYEAFASPNFPVLAEVGLDVKLSDQILKPSKKLQYSEKFQENVFSFRFHPGMPSNCLEAILHSGIQVVVVEALGVGNLPIVENSFVPWIAKMNEIGKIVAVNSQSPYGRVNLNLYESGKQVLEAGGISCEDMTTAASIVKLMILLGKYPGQPEMIKKEFLTPYAGELTLAEKNNS